LPFFPLRVSVPCFFDYQLSKKVLLVNIFSAAGFFPSSPYPALSLNRLLLESITASG